jgi:hypothetical protein
LTRTDRATDVGRREKPINSNLTFGNCLMAPGDREKVTRSKGEKYSFFSLLLAAIYNRDPILPCFLSVLFSRDV